MFASLELMHENKIICKLISILHHIYIVIIGKEGDNSML